MGEGEGHPVGPGRPGGVWRGSLVAYALTITDLDPIVSVYCSSASSSRASRCTILISICQDRTRTSGKSALRAERYGRTTRGAIIHSARCRRSHAAYCAGRRPRAEMPKVRSDKFAKLVPQHPLNPHDARAIEDETAACRRRVDRPGGAAPFNIAQKLEGSPPRLDPRPGIVIGERPLTAMVPATALHSPTCRDPVQLKWWSSGLGKVLFLCLKTLMSGNGGRRCCAKSAVETI